MNGRQPRRRSGGSPRAPQRVVRQRVRRRQGMPGWAYLVMVGVVLVVGGLVVKGMLSREVDPTASLLQRAHAARDVANYDQAKALVTQALSGIDESHVLYPAVTELHNEVHNLEATTQRIKQERMAKDLYHNNLHPFYERYLLTKEGKLRRDPSLARYFVDYRAQDYLDRFPDSEYHAQINGWVTTLRTLYREDDDFPHYWEDYEAISQHEQRLRHYGEVYRVLSQYLELNSQGNYKDDCEEERDEVLGRALRLWENELQPRIQGAMGTNPSYQTALNHALDGWNKLSDIPSLRGQIRKAAEEIQQRAKEGGIDVSLEKFQ